jgi:putative endonuclease
MACGRQRTSKDGFPPAHPRRMALSKRSASKGIRELVSRRPPSSRFVSEILARRNERRKNITSIAWTTVRPPTYPSVVNALIAAARRMAPEVTRGSAVVYFLHLRSTAIYVGCSTDLEQRLHDHLSGEACRTTAIDSPTAILRVEIFTSLREARRREAQLKKWSRAKKHALIRGDAGALRQLSQSRD